MTMGELGTVLLEGQKVMPKRLLALRYPFRFPRIEAALQDLLA
jgi:NAD dependent epimerase/dehydratase family enzyme